LCAAFLYGFNACMTSGGKSETRTAFVMCWV
jgi:hypothetical protein